MPDLPQRAAPPDDAVMLQVTKNILEIHKANELEKIGCLKYYGVIVTAVITVSAGIFRFGNTPERDYVLIFFLLLLIHLMGIVILRKLVAIRANIITLSIEFGNAHKFFMARYEEVGKYLGKSFRFYDENVKRINWKGSDAFNYVMIAVVNLAVAIMALWCLVQAIEEEKSVDLSWVIYIAEPVVVIINGFIFFWVVGTNDKACQVPRSSVSE